MRIYLAAAVVGLFGCSGGDEGGKAKLAADLVECKNGQSELKDQIASLNGQLAKVKAAQVCKLEPVDVKAQGGAKHVEGNISPDVVIKVVRQNSGGLRACYEKAL